MSYLYNWCGSSSMSRTPGYQTMNEERHERKAYWLENVAELIASTTLNMYPQVSAVRVQVGKPHVAVQGPVDYLGVEINRHRDFDV